MQNDMRQKKIYKSTIKTVSNQISVQPRTPFITYHTQLTAAHVIAFDGLF